MASFTLPPDSLQTALPPPPPSPFLLFGRVICSPPLSCTANLSLDPSPSPIHDSGGVPPVKKETDDCEEFRRKRSRWTTTPVPSPKHSDDRSSDGRSESLVLTVDSPADRNDGGGERERSDEVGRKKGIEFCTDARQRQIDDGVQDQRKAAASMASLINKEQESQQASGKTTQCPRCESYNTKFCYFNNYNVKQPRHFCRNCQRYWTAGGALRNVPVGSGRRRASRARRSTENGAAPAQIPPADQVVGASAEILRADHAATIASSSSSSTCCSSSSPASASQSKQEWQGLATQNAPLSSIPCKPASLVRSSSSPLASVCDPPQNPPSRENVSISISSSAADSSVPADPSKSQSFIPHIPHFGGVTGTPFIFHVPFTYQPPEAPSPAPAIVVLPYNASFLPWTCLATNSSSSSAQTPPLSQSQPAPPSVAPRNHSRHSHSTALPSAFHPFHSSDPAVINPTPFFVKIKAEKMDEI